MMTLRAQWRAAMQSSSAFCCRMTRARHAPGLQPTSSSTSPCYHTERRHLSCCRTTDLHTSDVIRANTPPCIHASGKSSNGTHQWLACQCRRRPGSSCLAPLEATDCRLHEGWSTRRARPESGTSCYGDKAFSIDRACLPDEVWSGLRARAQSSLPRLQNFQRLRLARSCIATTDRE